ncbi:MAG: NAD-dependent epimerase/dehydratase family protein, partial [Planctomycetota bacterium]
LAAEHYMRSFAEVYGMQTVILRYFNVFGPRQRADSPYSGVVAKFCQWTLDEETCLIEGDGEQSRDFTYVGDVARGNLLAMQADIPGCTLLNLAGGTRYSLNDFIATLERITGAPVKRRHVAPRTGDVKHSQAAVECARSALGFTTEVSFEEGLRRTLDWYRAVSRTT